MLQTNQEQAFHPIYHYAFITDAKEGLIVTNVDTLADGDFRNNFLKRDLTWNGEGADTGILNGARHVTVAGHYLYIAADRGLVIVNVDQPLHPSVAAILPLKDVRASAVQFRYLWATTADGLALVDITHPEAPRMVNSGLVKIADARKVYLARTFAYVASGAQGLTIVDIERPEQPRMLQAFNNTDAAGQPGPGGALTDTQDVVVGSTNASLFAYVADGVNGLKVIQLTAPDTQPKFYGFSPTPVPQVVAWRHTASRALALSKGLDRDRAVDETGGQIAVFGRIGSRPFTLPEMQKLFLRKDGSVWSVSDTPQAAGAAQETQPAAVTTGATR